MAQAQVEGAGLAIKSRRAALAEACASDHFTSHPELPQRYGAAGLEKCLEDADYHLAFLAEALASSAPTLFERYVQWARSMLAARNIPSSDLAENLAALRAVIANELPAENAQIATEYLDHALSRIDDGVQEPRTSPEIIRSRYWRAITWTRCCAASAAPRPR